MQAVTVRKWWDQYFKYVLREMRDKERKELEIEMHLLIKNMIQCTPKTMKENFGLSPRNLDSFAV